MSKSGGGGGGEKGRIKEVGEIGRGMDERGWEMTLPCSEQFLKAVI